MRVLLVLELITLRLFIIVLSVFRFGGSVGVLGFRLVFLVFGVYEAANGLGLLVSRRRSAGVDQLGSLFRLRF